MMISSAKHVGPMIRNHQSRKLITISGIMMIAMLGSVFGHGSFVHALEPIPMGIASGLQPGIVTSIGNQTLFISGKEYTLDNEVEIRDQEDNVLQADVIKPNQEVKFHLKKGEGNKIDVMVVYMPQ